MSSSEDFDLGLQLLQSLSSAITTEGYRSKPRHDFTDLSASLDLCRYLQMASQRKVHHHGEPLFLKSKHWDKVDLDRSATPSFTLCEKLILVMFS